MPYCIVVCQGRSLVVSWVARKPPSTQEGGGAASTTPTNNANMPRVPVRADTYTGMKRCRRLDLFPMQSGQGSVEKRAQPSETFRRDQQQPLEPSPSEPQQLLQPFRGLPSFANNELRVWVYRYGRVAMVRGTVRQLCGSIPFACARWQGSAFEAEGPKNFPALCTVTAAASQPLVPDWPVWNPPYCQPGYAPLCLL